MIEPLLEFFSTSDLIPLGDCFRWRPSLVWLSVISDSLIALSSFSITITLLLVVRHKVALSYRWIFGLFGGFILLWGMSHVLEVWTIWNPHYWLLDSVKGATGVVSVITAILLWTLLPKILALPNTEQLIKVNRELGEKLEMQKRTATELRKLSLAVEHRSIMMVITGTDGRIEYCNPTFLRVTGYPEAEVVGRLATSFRPAQLSTAAFEDLWRTLKQGDTWEGELLRIKKSGEPYWCLEYAAPIRNDQGVVTDYVTVAHDITELKKSEEKIRRLAFYDPLTGLPNRTLFKEFLEQTRRYAKRNGSIFAVVFLDLDRFKTVNESLGSAASDGVLVAVSQRLRKCLREDDTVARLGGDEFGVILTGLAHEKMAGAAAVSIVHALNEPFEIDGQSLFVTASIGISVYTADHAEVDQLLAMAESAMYSAKHMGRNQYQFYSEMPLARTPRQLSLETCLRYALEREEFQVFYQPKVDLVSKQCGTVEALLRWRHPEFGLVPPGQFIPIAEETGLIGAIGEWIIRRVCQQINSWKDVGVDLSVAVNLSPRQFRQKNLLERIDAILDETRVDRSRLEFEITESTAMNNPEQTSLILREMKKRGLLLSIDDFGTGYSSLSYLKLFPIDILKIDGSFVRDIGFAGENARIVQAIIALAHGLGLTVIAEGVETRAQVDFLKKYECDLVQGYFFSPPLPPEELLERLRDVGQALTAPADEVDAQAG